MEGQILQDEEGGGLQGGGSHQKGGGSEDKGFANV